MVTHVRSIPHPPVQIPDTKEYTLTLSQREAFIMWCFAHTTSWNDFKESINNTFNAYFDATSELNGYMGVKTLTNEDKDFIIGGFLKSFQDSNQVRSHL